MRNEETILNSLVKTGAGCTKSIRKNGDEISVCQIKTSGRYPYAPWNSSNPYAPWASSSTEEIITYKGGLIQTQEIRRAKKDDNFEPMVKITHQYKPANEPGYDIEETIITEFGESKPARVETRFRGTGTGKTVTENSTVHFGTFLGNEEQLLSVTDPRLNTDDFDKYCYDHVVFTTSVDENDVANSVYVSTPSGSGKYTTNQMILGPSSFGVTNIKPAFETCKWTVRHPVYPDLPVAKFYDNNVIIYDYEWRPTKYGNGKITRIRAFTNNMDTIVKYTAVADVLKGEYEPPEEVFYPETFPRTPYGETIDVKITEGEYAGSYFSFQIRAMDKKHADIASFYGGIKLEDGVEGFLVIPLGQTIKLAMNGNVPNSKKTIELKTIELIDPPKNAFIVRITENVNDAIMHYISNYEIDATKYIRASETYKYVQEDGTIIIQETEYVTPNVEEPDVDLSGV